MCFASRLTFLSDSPFSYILTPFGVWVGIREKKFVHASPNPILENYYLKNGMEQSSNGVNINCNNNNNTVKHLEVINTINIIISYIFMNVNLERPSM